METPKKKKTKNKWAIVAGLALLAMAVLVPIANFALLGTLVSENAQTTVQKVMESPALLVGAILCFLLVIALDFVVAVALCCFFEPTRLRVNTLVALSRIIYGFVFLGAVGFLIKAALATLSAGASIAEDIALFHTVWDVALIVFAIHLVLLGWLFIKTSNTPTWLAPLLMIAGLGYGIDSIGRLFIQGYSIEIATVAFVGEVVLILWLLMKGRKLTSLETT